MIWLVAAIRFTSILTNRSPISTLKMHMDSGHDITIAVTGIHPTGCGNAMHMMAGLHIQELWIWNGTFFFVYFQGGYVYDIFSLSKEV